jgi:hypothetical protein
MNEVRVHLADAAAANRGLANLADVHDPRGGDGRRFPGGSRGRPAVRLADPNWPATSALGTSSCGARSAGSSRAWGSRTEALAAAADIQDLAYSALTPEEIGGVMGGVTVYTYRCEAPKGAELMRLHSGALFEDKVAGRAIFIPTDERGAPTAAMLSCSASSATPPKGSSRQ